MKVPTALPLLSGLALVCSCGHVAMPVALETPSARRATLDRLRAEYQTSSDPSTRVALEERIDGVARQRHAVWSGLLWHTELDEAIAEARTTGKPILSLRLLGRLDEELSCANSRFFRVALYANEELSTYLREHFVLHWSSERPVPVARIDFGDGRVMERTIAGNSAHYILDARGRPVDILPGLYTPAAFRAALERAESVARMVSPLEDTAQAQRVAAFHQEEQTRVTGELVALLRRPTRRAGTLIEAERVAMTKAVVELPVASRLELGPQPTLGETARWEQRDQRWGELGERMTRDVQGSGLDAHSRALLTALAPTDWSRPGRPLPREQLQQVVSAFETSLRRDTAYNELGLHARIHQWFAAAPEAHTFAAANAWLYRELFLTPADDLWLGMSTPGLFTGLPADGVRTR